MIKLTAIHYTRRKHTTATPANLPRKQVGRVQTHVRPVYRGVVPAADSPDLVSGRTPAWPATPSQLPQTPAGA